MVLKSVASKRAGALLLTQIALHLAGCAGSPATEPGIAGAARQSPPPEAAYSEQQRNYVASLDKLLAERNYGELANAVGASSDTSLIGPALDWGQSRMMAGKSLIVPLLYSTKLWAVGSASPQYANSRETAGLIAIYSLMVTYADGVNFAQGTKNSTVEWSHFRNNGDNSIATSSTGEQPPSDQFAPPCTNNIFRHNTVENTYRACGMTISGGSAICGKSGVSVCVRSTTRMRPLASASARLPRSDVVACMSDPLSPTPPPQGGRGLFERCACPLSPCGRGAGGEG